MPEPRDGDHDGRVGEGTPSEHGVPAGVTLRAFGDAAATRDAIYKNVHAAASSIGEVGNTRHALTVHDVHWQGPDSVTPAQQKRAVLEGSTLARRLVGTYVLKDKETGGELGRKTTTLAHVPILTDDGTFISSGSAYSLASQMRLRAGIFARRKENGELESHVSVLPGTGVSHRIHMEPETGQFKVQLGQAHLPLLPLLKAMGATDREVDEAWGRDLAHANRLKGDGQAIQKLHARLVRNPEQTPEGGHAAAVAAAFRAMPLDPEVTQRTLGHPHDHVTKDALLATTKKLIAINKGEQEPDDRDHPAYMTVHGPEDLLAERVHKDKGTLRRMLWKVSRTGDVQGLLPGLLTKPVQAAILSSGLGQPGENVNPLMVLAQRYRVSRLGTGGIPSTASIPNESRNVHPAQLGFIDPVASPESLAAGVDQRIARTARKGSDGRMYARFTDARSGKAIWRSPQDLAEKALAFPGELASGKPTVNVVKGGKLAVVTRDAVDYELPAMEDAFTPVANMVPMKSGIKPQRAVMAARMLEQALPLVGAEAPLVQSAIPGTNSMRSFEEHHGRDVGAVRAGRHGVVEKVEDDAIHVRYAGDSRATPHHIHNHAPSNRKTGFHQSATVNAGDPVVPGQLIARSNYTDDHGTVALGRNLRTAYIPTGHNFEDAVEISESASRKLTSDHYYQHQLDLDPGVVTGRNNHVALFPAAHDRQTLDKFDEHGVVKPGTEVDHGHPLILAARKRDRSHGTIHAGHKATYSDATVNWEHHSPGVVTDVAKTPKGHLVTVKTHAVSLVGDKLSGKFGDKGVISKITPDEEMPHDEQGRPIEVALNPLGIISRCYDAETEFLTGTGWKFGKDVEFVDQLVCYHPWSENLYLMAQLEPMHVAPYQGPMLTFSNKLMDFCVTPNHRMWTRCGYPGAPWQEATAERIYRKNWNVPVAGNPLPGVESPFVLPHLDYHVKDTASDRGEIVITAEDWAEFLGWYVAEGNTDEKVHISQSATANPAKCKVIEALLARLPFAWHYNEKNSQFHITSKRLCEYLKPLGLCSGKFIPDWVFSQPYAIRQRFLDAYWAGDGGYHEFANGQKIMSAGSRSLRLVDDLQRLLIYQGVSAATYSIRTKHEHLPMWRCARHFQKTRLLEDKSWSTVEYDGTVYCPTVPTGYVVTRRNGKVLIAGNTNPSQMVEAALGKVAAATGRPYKVEDFGAIPNLTAYAQQELARHGLSDTETLTDPKTGRRIPGVFTGNRFIMKLHHTSESKSQGRSTGGYTSDDAPAKGGNTGSKRVSLGELSALLSHGATSIIRDAGSVRGQANPEYWQRVMSGHEPPTPEVSHAYRKFWDQLRAAGINPVRTGTKTHFLALTGKDVESMAGDRQLTNAETVDWKDGMKPVPGGLFDPRATGAHGGSNWSSIPLAEPMVNPVLEEPARHLLDLTRAGFRDVLAGRRELPGHGTGPRAIASALDAIDVPRALEQARGGLRRRQGGEARRRRPQDRLPQVRPGPRPPPRGLGLESRPGPAAEVPPGLDHEGVGPADG